MFVKIGDISFNTSPAPIDDFDQKVIRELTGVFEDESFLDRLLNKTELSDLETFVLRCALAGYKAGRK
jgi:hypothetical protein